MARIIVETKVQECHKFEHKHKGIKGLLEPLLLGSNYCPECGEYLKEEKPITTRRCSDCGKVLLWDGLLYKYKFCPECGIKFED